MEQTWASYINSLNQNSLPRRVEVTDGNYFSGRKKKDGEFWGQKKHKPANSKDEGFLISPGCETSGMEGVYYLDYAGGC